MKNYQELIAAKQKAEELRECLAKANAGATLMEHIILLDIINKAYELLQKITVFKNAVEDGK